MTFHRNREDALVIEQVLIQQEAESDLLIQELLHNEKQLEVNSYHKCYEDFLSFLSLIFFRLKGYIQQLQTAISEENPTRSLLTTKELAEKTAQQEQTLQKLSVEKQRHALEAQEAQKTMLQELKQQQKTVLQSHNEIHAELQRTKQLRAKFGSAIADKYQEVVQHVHYLEQTQKLTKSKDKRTPISPVAEKTGDRRPLFASTGGREGGITKTSGHHSSFNLLDSGSSAKRAGNRSPTEKDAPVSIRAAKGFTSSYTLLEKRRADRSGGGRREDIAKGDDTAIPDHKEIKSPLMEGTKADECPGIQLGLEPSLADSQNGQPTGIQANSQIPSSSQLGPRSGHNTASPSSSPQLGLVGAERLQAVVSSGQKTPPTSGSGSPTELAGSPPPLGWHTKSYLATNSETPHGLQHSVTNQITEVVHSPTPIMTQQGGRIGTPAGKGQVAKLQAGARLSSPGPAGQSSNAHIHGVEGVGISYDFRSIALVQNELASRLAATRLHPSDLDATRDQVCYYSFKFQLTFGDGYISTCRWLL